MKKIIGTLAVAAALIVPTGASAHKVAGWDQAYSAGYWHAQQDCGRAWDWICQNVPIAGPQVQDYDSHTWIVRTWYQEARPWDGFATRVCHTTVQITHGGTVYSAKYC